VANKNFSAPRNNKKTTATAKFSLNTNYKPVYVTIENNFYLNGIKYSGPAYIRPNGVYTVQNPKHGSDIFIDLVNKSRNKPTVLSNKRVLSKTVKASLDGDKNNFKNNKQVDRIQRMIKGTRSPNKRGTRNMYRKLGK